MGLVLLETVFVGRSERRLTQNRRSNFHIFGAAEYRKFNAEGDKNGPRRNRGTENTEQRTKGQKNHCLGGRE